MPDVIISEASYSDDSLKGRVFDLMDAVGGHRIRAGARVLIKPNLLTVARPQQAVTTHPAVVRAVAEYALDRGARVRISDSPATGSFDRILKVGGYRAALDGLDVEFRPFEFSMPVDIGAPFGRIELARAAMAADVVINLAKLKTHAQMTLTLGVKNLFGCVVGLKKPEWHFRSGEDRGVFARLLVQICRAVKPAITLVDGILVMDGQGPGKSGRPRPLGVLVGGNDAVAVDWAICSLVGLPVEEFPVWRAARELGMGSEEITVEGEVRPVADFRFPEPGAILFGPPAVQNFLRQHLVQRPVVDPSRCRLCGECWRYCPAGAVEGNQKAVRFDYQRCIRCYCCVEVCPEGALAAVDPLPARLVKRIGWVRRRL